MVSLSGPGGGGGLSQTHQLGGEDAYIGAQTGLSHNRSKSKYVGTDAIW